MTTEAHQSAQSRGLFYGWRIVGALFIVLATTAGLGFYNASVILTAAEKELGLSTTVVSAATAMFFGVGGITGFALAKLMDTVDIRRFYLVGGVLGALTLYGLRWVDSGFGLFVFFTLFGVSFAVAGLVPSTTLVARWFDRRRAVALSVASTGLSVGGITITPFIGRALEDHTLAEVGPWLGLAWVVGVVPITWLVLRSWPTDLNMGPDGVAMRPGEVADVSSVPGATFAQAKASRFYRLLCAVYALVFLAQVGGIAHLYNLTSSRVSTATAGAALSTMAASSVMGRLAGGVLVTRVSSRIMTGVLIVVQSAALAIIGFVDTRMGILLGAAIFGLSVGNLLMLQPLLLAETFGVREYSRIYSFNQLFGTIGVAGGPFALGAFKDLIDYRAAFLIAAAANVVGFVLLMMAGSTEDARSGWERPTVAG
ncbi:MAG: MFS transporter [Actinomycetia bacterium]|nr:MFS transporter [Actinomycetes bacterium]